MWKRRRGAPQADRPGLFRGAMSAETNPMIQWLDEAPGSDPDAHLERLCAAAGALLQELGALATFPSARAVLAWILIQEYSSARGLEVAEVAALLPRVSEHALQAVDYLRKAAGRQRETRMVTNHQKSKSDPRLIAAQWGVSPVAGLVGVVESDRTRAGGTPQRGRAAGSLWRHRHDRG